MPNKFSCVLNQPVTTYNWDMYSVEYNTRYAWQKYTSTVGRYLYSAYGYKEYTLHTYDSYNYNSAGLNVLGDKYSSKGTAIQIDYNLGVLPITEYLGIVSLQFVKEARLNHPVLMSMSQVFNVLGNCGQPEERITSTGQAWGIFGDTIHRTSGDENTAYAVAYLGEAAKQWLSERDMFTTTFTPSLSKGTSAYSGIYYGLVPVTAEEYDISQRSYNFANAQSGSYQYIMDYANDGLVTTTMIQNGSLTTTEIATYDARALGGIFLTTPESYLDTATNTLHNVYLVNMTHFLNASTGFEYDQRVSSQNWQYTLLGGYVWDVTSHGRFPMFITPKEKIETLDLREFGPTADNKYIAYGGHDEIVPEVDIEDFITSYSATSPDEYPNNGVYYDYWCIGDYRQYPYVWQVSDLFGNSWYVGTNENEQPNLGNRMTCTFQYEQQPTVQKGDYLYDVYDLDSNKYPEDGYDDESGYWYIAIGEDTDWHGTNFIRAITTFEPNVYPSNGRKNGYWYIYTGSRTSMDFELTDQYIIGGVNYTKKSSSNSSGIKLGILCCADVSFNIKYADVLGPLLEQSQMKYYYKDGADGEWQFLGDYYVRDVKYDTNTTANIYARDALYNVSDGNRKYTGYPSDMNEKLSDTVDRVCAITGLNPPAEYPVWWIDYFWKPYALTEEITCAKVLEDIAEIQCAICYVENNTLAFKRITENPIQIGNDQYVTYKRKPYSTKYIHRLTVMVDDSFYSIGDGIGPYIGNSYDTEKNTVMNLLTANGDSVLESLFPLYNAIEYTPSTLTLLKDVNVDVGDSLIINSSPFIVFDKSISASGVVLDCLGE